MHPGCTKIPFENLLWSVCTVPSRVSNNCGLFIVREKVRVLVILFWYAVHFVLVSKKYCFVYFRYYLYFRYSGLSARNVCIIDYTIAHRACMIEFAFSNRINLGNDIYLHGSIMCLLYA